MTKSDSLSGRDRLEGVTLAESRYDMLMAAETHEEPASKAAENRLRVAFLATRGNTMAMWLAQRDAILAEALDDPSGSSAS
jgi:hypothetical protein